MWYTYISLWTHTGTWGTESVHGIIKFSDMQWDPVVSAVWDTWDRWEEGGGQKLTYSAKVPLGINTKEEQLA